MKAIILVSGMALTLGLVMHPAFAGAASEPMASATDKTETTTLEATPPAEKSEDDFSDGMRIPVDGSSLETFDKSLALIQTKTTADEYTTLRNAIDYLLVYNLAAKRDRAKLARYLDGLTGREIIGKVNWNKSSK